jgi:hypothetical protein
MVADGGVECADRLWYCRDIPECTDRWTSRPMTEIGETDPAGSDDTRPAAG